jgi:parallel beta-helix repeat protein
LKRIACILLLIFLVVMSFSSVRVQPSRAASTMIVVPDDYPTIQAAINHANAGDTVFVRAGVYHENVVVNRSITLQGENRNTTMIQATKKASDIGAVTVTSENVTFSEFTVSGGGEGVLVQNSGCNISHNYVSTGYHFEGVFLDGRTEPVDNNIVEDNIVVNNDDAGIAVWTSNNNHIESNTLENNGFGIFLYTNSSMNLVEKNEVVNNSVAGIVASQGSDNNIIAHNNVSKNGWDPWSYAGGISLGYESTANRVISNNVCYNKEAIELGYFSDDNVFYHNNFINNTVQVFSYYVLSNVWDGGYSEGGNYWSVYQGKDVMSGPYQNVTGSDGVGDTPYAVDTYNQDKYPLMKPYSPMIGDCNDDGAVDLKDLYLVAMAFGSYVGSSNWNPQADLNNDGTVNIIDYFIVCVNMGKTYIPNPN